MPRRADGQSPLHELSLCQSLIALVADYAGRHGLARVTEVCLEVGALSCIEPRALAFCFDAVARGTPAEGAALSIEIVPVDAWCWTCSRTVAITDRDATCPLCDHPTLRATDPRDLKLTEIAGEQGDGVRS